MDLDSHTIKCGVIITEWVTHKWYLAHSSRLLAVCDKHTTHLSALRRRLRNDFQLQQQICFSTKSLCCSLNVWPVSCSRFNIFNPSSLSSAQCSVLFVSYHAGGQLRCFRVYVSMCCDDHWEFSIKHFRMQCLHMHKQGELDPHQRRDVRTYLQTCLSGFLWWIVM